MQKCNELKQLNATRKSQARQIQDLSADLKITKELLNSKDKLNKKLKESLKKNSS
jgi:hypothetical protein